MGCEEAFPSCEEAFPSRGRKCRRSVFRGFDIGIDLHVSVSTIFQGFQLLFAPVKHGGCIYTPAEHLQGTGSFFLLALVIDLRCMLRLCFRCLWRLCVPLLRQAFPSGPVLGAKGGGGPSGRDQHLHRLQPGVPRPHLQGEGGLSSLRSLVKYLVPDIDQFCCLM